MALSLIFAGLAPMDMATITVQNFAIRASVLPEKDYALNPKVNNLIAACEASRFLFFLISDSDMIAQYLNKEK